VIIAHGRIADALFAQGRYQAAIPEYRAYLAVRPQFVIPWTNLGISLAATADPSGAVEAFDRAVAIEPLNSGARRNLANALLETHDYRRAAEQAREALRLAPQDAVAREILSLALAGGAR
jgi:tetratricopeptide (TPR) repeat protein